MNNEMEQFDPKEIPSPEAKRTVAFFSGEGDPEFIEKEAMQDLVDYAYSMKKTKEDVDAKLKKAVDEIKRRLDAGTMQDKKLVKAFGERQVILTKRAGACKVDWPKYVEDEIGQKARVEMELCLEAVKAGEAKNEYISQGDDSVACEIV